MGTKEDYERQKAEKKSQKYRFESLRGFGRNTFRHPDRMIRFTWWVAVFTFCLACVGFIQAWAFIQSERAFVGVLGIDPNFKIEQDKILVAQIRFKNAGRATALIIDANATTRITSDPLPVHPPYMRGAETRVIGPITAGQEQTATMIPKFSDGTSLRLTSDYMKSIEGGRQKLYIFGFFKYSDDFSILGDRTTGYCLVYVPKFDERTATFDICGDANYAYAR